MAIVGPTGAGKTTLVNLLMRFYEVDGGRITLDGVDIAAMTREELRAKTGMVLQDAWLFGGTHRRQHRLRRRPAPPGSRSSRRRRPPTSTGSCARCPTATTRCIDDEGANVSTGEKQLITIARAFLAEPAILILDEATSSVDTRTEVLIQRAMNSLRQRPDQLRHRAPAVHDPRRGPDPGDGVRPHRRAGHARTTCSPRAAPTPGCTPPSSPRRWPRSSSAWPSAARRPAPVRGTGPAPVRRIRPADGRTVVPRTAPASARSRSSGPD